MAFAVLLPRVQLRTATAKKRARTPLRACSGSPSSPSSSSTLPATVIGAGMSGLAAAHRLSAAGLSVRVLEASDGVGGRVRSDVVQGFTLDRGFQVFIEAYPEQRALLGDDGYAALDLRRFRPGSMIRTDGGFCTIADPFRAPIDSLKGLFAPVGSFADKVRVAALRVAVMTKTPESLLRGSVPGTMGAATRSFLGTAFSDQFIDRFFRPFYEGIFLAPLSEQAASLFVYVFRMFAAAPVSLPARGIGALSDQLAASLPSNVTIELNHCVENLQTVIEASSVVVVATDGRDQLLPSTAMPEPVSRGSICLYFSSSKPAPISEPILVLNGEGKSSGCVNNMFIPSNVVPEYAPKGKTLISTTIVGDELGKSDAELEAAVRRQMTEWFGEPEVSAWTVVRTYRIPHSQPAQGASIDYSHTSAARVADFPNAGVFVCGDHTATPTINGALESGRRAAEAALAYLNSH